MNELTHFHSSDNRFCGSKQQGRRFSLNVEEITCLGCLNRLEKFIFVFGSNLAGIHGAGAAKFAYDNHGAKYGQGIGLQGKSYGIPTKDKKIKTLPLSNIAHYVEEFLAFAYQNPHYEFFVTRIGCGLAGYKDEDIAPMFICPPKNCVMPEEWEEKNLIKRI